MLHTNIKAPDLPVSDMNFEVALFWSYVPTCGPGAGPVLTQGHHMNKLDREKKNFEFYLLCSYVPTCDPGTGPVLTQGVSNEQT